MSCYNRTDCKLTIAPCVNMDESQCWIKKEYGLGWADCRATLKGLSGFLPLMNLFAWAQDWRASHLYPVYTTIRFTLFFLVTNECYKINLNTFIYIYLPLERGWKGGKKQGWVKVYFVNWTKGIMNILYTSRSSKHSLGNILFQRSVRAKLFS